MTTVAEDRTQDAVAQIEPAVLGRTAVLLFPAAELLTVAAKNPLLDATDPSRFS